MYVGRSAVRDVADKRLPLLNEYLKVSKWQQGDPFLPHACLSTLFSLLKQALFELPDKIRYDTIVHAFVRQTNEDIAKPYLGNQAYKTRPNGSIRPARPAGPPTKQVKPALPSSLHK